MPTLKELLVTPPAGVTKFAVEMPDRQQIEQDFGHMAFAFLRDRAPSLLPYMIGFEVVEQEPDGSRAVGIFGFNINNSFWYVPCFFTNNQIKGMDLLYSVSKSSFVPLQESWINHILDRQLIEMGEPANNKVMKTIENPNFDFLSGPPATPKSAAAWLNDAKQEWEKLGADIATRMNSDPQFQEALAGAIAAMTGEVVELEKKASTPLLDFLTNVAGPGAVATVLRTFEDPNFLKAACAFYDYRDLLIKEFNAKLFPKQAASVKVLTETEIKDYGNQCPAATAEAKTRTIRDGFTIVDDRPPEAHTEMYEVDYDRQIFNPDHPGKYRLILRGGAQVPVHVLIPLFRASRPGMVIVVEPDSKRYLACDASALHLQDLKPEDAKPEDQTYLYDKGVAVDDLKLGETYILVDELQNSSLSFTVDSTTKQDGELAKLKVQWHDYPSYDGPRPWSNAGKELASEYSPYPSGRQANIDWYRLAITPTDRKGKLYVSGGGQMIVPTKSWKAFKLDRAEYENGRAGAQLVPASRVDIDEMMTKAGAHRLSVSGDGGEYAIRLDGMLDQQQLSYKSAAVRLVRDYALKVADAETMLKEADAQGKARRLVKFGQVIMQPPPPQQIGTDPLIGAQVLTPYELLMSGQTIGAPAIKQYTGPGSGFNLGGDGATQQAAGAAGPEQPPALPPDVTQLAQQAAQTGQNQVFDHGVIGGLSRMYDVSTAIDSYVPELLKTVDRLGRILFLFYWKNTEFAERYGSQDLTSLEDQLRAVFKNLGDLTLKLRQKSIDSQEGEFVPAQE